MAEIGPTPQLYTLDGWPQTWADLLVRLHALRWREYQQRLSGEVCYRRWLSHNARAA